MTKLIPLFIVVGVLIVGLNLVAFKLFQPSLIFSAALDTLGIVCIVIGYLLATQRRCS